MCIIRRAARLTPGATARCCAVGSARGLGPRGRRFESCHLDHVGAKSALLRRLFLPAAQKAAGCVAPLLLLPAKSHAAPSLFACKRAHNASACYQLFADKGKGIVFYFCRAEALTGELRFCEAKVEFLKLPRPVCPHRRVWLFPRPLCQRHKLFQLILDFSSRFYIIKARETSGVAGSD